jgi:outer membrane protein OmpA-like peptidoglycan-associated protein
MRRLVSITSAAALVLASGAALAQHHRPHGHGGFYYRGGPGYVVPYYAYGVPVYPPAYYYDPYPVYVERAPRVYVESRPPEPAQYSYAERNSRSFAQVTPPMERYTLSARELFDFDKATLRLPQPKLDEIAAALTNNPQIEHVRITGYTDRLGSEAYNLKLSQRRANAVKSYLVSRHVAANRLTTAGKGEANPVVQCNDRNQAALIKCLEPNRRVEVEQITIEVRRGQL